MRKRRRGRLKKKKKIGSDREMIMTERENET